MAVPAIITAGVISRFGPWFGRVASSKPNLLGALVAKLRTGGAVVGDKVSDIISFVKSNPVNASLTLATLASLGIAASDLFGGEEMTPEMERFVAGLDSTASFVTPAQRDAAAKRIMDAGSMSETMVTGLAEREVETLSAIEVLSWARGHFGSASAAMRAHRLMQAFVEMSYEDVRTGFATLRLN